MAKSYDDLVRDFELAQRQIALLKAQNRGNEIGHDLVQVGILGGGGFGEVLLCE